MTVDITKLNTTASAALPPPVVPPVVPPVKAAAKKSYRVQLEGEPAVDVRDCVDRLDAQEKYMKMLGINSSTRKFTYTEIE